MRRTVMKQRRFASRAKASDITLRTYHALNLIVCRYEDHGQNLVHRYHPVTVGVNVSEEQSDLQVTASARQKRDELYMNKPEWTGACTHRPGVQVDVSEDLLKHSSMNRLRILEKQVALVGEHTSHDLNREIRRIPINSGSS